MNIEECYNRMGGDYAQVLLRLPSGALVKKFITKFLDDGTYQELCRAMEQGDRELAFRAAHTLKGVCANLSLDRLFHSASRLTELLRAETDFAPTEADRLLQEVTRDYEWTVRVIRAYLKLDTSAE